MHEVSVDFKAMCTKFRTHRSAQRRRGMSDALWAMPAWVWRDVRSGFFPDQTNRGRTFRDIAILIDLDIQSAPPTSST